MEHKTSTALCADSSLKQPISRFKMIAEGAVHITGHITDYFNGSHE